MRGVVPARMSDETPPRLALEPLLLSTAGAQLAVVSHGDHVMSVYDGATGSILQVTDGWVAQYGYSREEALRMRVMDVSAEPDATRSALAQATVRGGCRVDLRWHRRKDGSVFPVDISTVTLLVGERTVHCSILRDLTAQRSSEEQRIRSEARFRALVEGSPDGIAVHRADVLAYMNPALRAMLGVPADEDLAGRSLFEFVVPDERAAILERARTVVASGVTDAHAERLARRRDGTMLNVETAVIPIEFDGEPSVLALIRDVTARKRLEAQLVMADRLASLGRLAASVGHEINNPVAYVLSNVEMLERELSRAAESAPQLREHLVMIREGVERVRDIVRDVRTLSSPDAQTVGPIDVRRLLELCVKMADHEIRSRARVIRDFDEPLFVAGSEARLGQVFLNLLVNAAHAIAPGRREDNTIRVRARRVGSAAVIDVSDTGSGIAPELSDRIFEPFFTTKTDGTGTGLGLSICHSIVVSLGGSIAAEANEPRGARFVVTLPVAHDSA